MRRYPPLESPHREIETLQSLKHVHIKDKIIMELFNKTGSTVFLLLERDQIL